MSTQEVEQARIFYLRDSRGNRVACIAYQKARPTAGDYLTEFAISTHNPKDKFNKEVARTVALGRLNKETGKVGWFSWVPTGKTNGETKLKIVKVLAIQKYFPTRTRDAAKLWMEKYNSFKAQAVEASPTNEACNQNG